MLCSNPRCRYLYQCREPVQIRPQFSQEAETECGSDGEPEGGAEKKGQRSH